MEISQQQLPNDSFSHGWLISIKPPFDFLGDSHRSLDGAGSFIEMDPHLLSMRWSSGQHADVDGEFDFGGAFDRTPLPSQLANADQIFYDGHLLPFGSVPSPPRFDAAAAVEALMDPAPVSNSARPKSSKPLLSRSHTTASCFDPVPSRTSTSASSSPAFHSAPSTPRSSASSFKSLPLHGSGKIHSPLVRNLCVKSPGKLLFKYLRFLIPLLKKIKSLKMASSKQTERSSKVSARSSPRSSSAFSSMEWCRSNADISISDAILYCKRSNGQDSK